MSDGGTTSDSTSIRPSVLTGTSGKLQRPASSASQMPSSSAGTAVAPTSEAPSASTEILAIVAGVAAVVGTGVAIRTEPGPVGAIHRTGVGAALGTGIGTGLETVWDVGAVISTVQRGGVDVGAVFSTVLGTDVGAAVKPGGTGTVLGTGVEIGAVLGTREGWGADLGTAEGFGADHGAGEGLGARVDEPVPGKTGPSCTSASGMLRDGTLPSPGCFDSRFISPGGAGVSTDLANARTGANVATGDISAEVETGVVVSTVLGAFGDVGAVLRTVVVIGSDLGISISISFALGAGGGTSALLRRLRGGLPHSGGAGELSYPDLGTVAG